MNKYAQKVTVNLMDGDIKGRYELTLDNWNIITFKIPRDEVKISSDLRYISKPGIYFLFGEQNTHNSIYIGKTDNVFDSLLKHSNKNNGYRWDDAVVFVSSDSSLDIIKLDYLENRLYTIINDSKSYSLLNSVNYTNHVEINDSDLGPMEKLINNIKSVIPFTGYDPFKIMTISENIVTYDLNKLVYFKHGSNRFNAVGILNKDGGITIFKGSKFSDKTLQSLPKSICKKRNELINSGILKDFILQRDLSFSSVSSAANTISGTSSNGFSSWKDINGKSLKSFGRKK